jgi:hypothetical protein
MTPSSQMMIRYLPQACARRRVVRACTAKAPHSRRESVQRLSMMIVDADPLAAP